MLPKQYTQLEDKALRYCPLVLMDTLRSTNKEQQKTPSKKIGAMFRRQHKSTEKSKSEVDVKQRLSLSEKILRFGHGGSKSATTTPTKLSRSLSLKLKSSRSLFGMEKKTSSKVSSGKQNSNTGSNLLSVKKLSKSQSNITNGPLHKTQALESDTKLSFADDMDETADEPNNSTDGKLTSEEVVSVEYFLNNLAGIHSNRLEHESLAAEHHTAVDCSGRETSNSAVGETSQFSTPSKIKPENRLLTPRSEQTKSGQDTTPPTISPATRRNTWPKPVHISSGWNISSRLALSLAEKIIPDSAKDDLKGWQDLIKKTQKTISEAQKLRYDLNSEHEEFREMNNKTDQLKTEVTTLNCRMKNMCERWEFMDQVVKQAEDAGDRIMLVEMPADGKFLKKYRTGARPKSASIQSLKSISEEVKHGANN